MNIFFDDKKGGLKIDDTYTSLCIDEIAIADSNVDESEKLGEAGAGEASSKKINFLFLTFIVGVLVLISRIYYLQIARGSHYSSIAEGNRIRIQTIKPRRGIIYDRNYNPLVVNVPSFSLKLIQSDFPKEENEKEKLLNDIASLIDVRLEDVKKILEDKAAYYYQPVIIKEDITYEQAILIYIKSIDMPGVVLEEVSRRFYISNDDLNSLSHILGYDGKISEKELNDYKDDGYMLDDYIGKTGIELSFEQELRGEVGKAQVETNALGKQIRVIAKKDSVSGKDVVLSVDKGLQNYIEELLKNELAEIEKENAVVVVMDPRNGEIISLVSFPSYNNNLFVGGISNDEYQNLIEDSLRPLFNRAIAGTYPPGSTFKPVMSAIALEEGVITENTRIKSVGGIWVGQWFFPDWSSSGHGLVNVKSAIANSVNTFFYYIGGGYEDFKGLGLDLIINKAEQFGLGNDTGIDLPGENKGFLPTEQWKLDNFNEPWYIGDTYHLSIGQGYLLVTPLQVALYTSFFANGGIIYRPKIARGVINKDKTIELYPREYINKDFIDSKNVASVKQGMRDAVVYGSARSLSTLSFDSAGKTGTAQTSNNKEPHAWFTCFAPYEKPEIVVTVLVEEGGEGSEVSVPIAKKILEYWWLNSKKQ